MCLSSGLCGGVLDCDSQFTFLSPLLFNGPQCWRSMSVRSSLHLRASHERIVSDVLPRSLCGWPRTSLHLLEEGNNNLSVRFAYLFRMIGKEFVFFPSCTSSFLSLVYKSLSTIDPHLPTTKLKCSNSHFGAAALNTLMMLLCCSFASASFTFRRPLSLSQCWQFKFQNIYDLIATPSGRLPQERCTKKATGSRLCRASWLFLTGIVISISCAFSLLQIFKNSSRRHSVLMLLSMSNVTNLGLLFGFCAACMLSYRCLQMEWWAAFTVVAIPSQPALLMWPCVSAARPSVLSPRVFHAILHSRHPADCILPILVRKLTVGVIPATAIHNRLLHFPGIFLSLRYFPSINLPASSINLPASCYQSHSVTLTCVDHDSYQSRLGLTTLESTEKYLRVYSLGISPAFIRKHK